MANKDYDELMQAFMNNSQKVYNEDKEAQNKNAKKLPTSYSTFDNKGAKNSKKKSSDKKNGNKKGGSGEKKVGKTILKILLGIIIVIAVVGIICSSVLFVYGYSVVHGDVVFNLDDEASSQNQTSFIAITYAINSVKKAIQSFNNNKFFFFNFRIHSFRRNLINKCLF